MNPEDARLVMAYSDLFSSFLWRSGYLSRAGRMFMYKEYTSVVPLRLTFSDDLRTATLQKMPITNVDKHFINVNPGLRFCFRSFQRQVFLGAHGDYEARVSLKNIADVSDFSSQEVLRSMIDRNTQIFVKSNLFVGTVHRSDDWNEDAYYTPIEAVDHQHFTSKDAPLEHKIKLFIKGTILNWYLVILVVILVVCLAYLSYREGKKK